MGTLMTDAREVRAIFGVTVVWLFLLQLCFSHAWWSRRQVGISGRPREYEQVVQTQLKPPRDRETQTSIREHRRDALGVEPMMLMKGNPSHEVKALQTFKDVVNSWRWDCDQHNPTRRQEIDASIPKIGDRVCVDVLEDGEKSDRIEGFL
jgi:hypothetical protein